MTEIKYSVQILCVLQNGHEVVLHTEQTDNKTLCWMLYCVTYVFI